MHIKKLLACSILAVGISAGASTTANAVEIYLNAPPPAVVYEVAPDPRPGYVWAPGYWQYTGASTKPKWRKGKWVKARPGYVYRPARWVEVEDGRWYFEDSDWLYEEPKERVMYIERDGHKAGYWKSEYSDWDYVKKGGRGRRVSSR